jgi:TolB-like protein
MFVIARNTAFTYKGKSNDAKGPAEPHAEYPDIDLRVTAQGYVRKDGTPYS